MLVILVSTKKPLNSFISCSVRPVSTKHGICFRVFFSVFYNSFFPLPSQPPLEYRLVGFSVTSFSSFCVLHRPDTPRCCPRTLWSVTRWVTRYLEIGHFLGQSNDLPSAENIDVDCDADVLVKPDRSRCVENDVYLVGQRLPIGRGQAQPRQWYVASHRRYLVVEFWPLVFQPHKQLKHKRTYVFKNGSKHVFEIYKYFPFPFPVLPSCTKHIRHLL